MVNASSHVFDMLLDTSSDAAHTIAGVGAVSADCIIQSSLHNRMFQDGNPILSLLMIDFFIPTVIFSGSVASGAVQIYRFSDLPDTFGVACIRPFIVFTNIFLPQIMGIFLRASPCIHTQVDSGLQVKGSSLMAYALDIPCAPRPRWSFVLIASGIVITLLLGPVSWLILLRHSKQWGILIRKKIFGFIIKEYKPEFETWETRVLLCRMALVAIAAVFPRTYATMTHLGLLLIVLGTALVSHTMTWPYKSHILNGLELLALGAPSVCLIFCTLLVHEGWSLTQELQQFIWVLTVIILVAVLLLLGAAMGITFFKGFKQADCFEKPERFRHHGFARITDIHEFPQFSRGRHRELTSNVQRQIWQFCHECWYTELQRQI